MQSIQEQQNEAFYHFTLANMMDLIRQHGYCNVINDLDAMIEEEISRKMEVVYE